MATCIDCGQRLLAPNPPARCGACRSRTVRVSYMAPLTAWLTQLSDEARRTGIELREQRTARVVFRFQPKAGELSDGFERGAEAQLAYDLIQAALSDCQTAGNVRRGFRVCTGADLITGRTAQFNFVCAPDQREPLADEVGPVESRSIVADTAQAAIAGLERRLAAERAEWVAKAARLDRLVETFPPGPTQDRMRALAERLDRIALTERALAASAAKRAARGQPTPAEKRAAERLREAAERESRAAAREEKQAAERAAARAAAQPTDPVKARMRALADIFDDEGSAK